MYNFFNFNYDLLVTGILLIFRLVFYSCLSSVFVCVCVFAVCFCVISSDSAIASKLLSQCVKEQETELKI
jgi:hypothetical protein